MDCIFQPGFTQLYILIFLAFLLPHLINFVFKAVGLEYLNDDHFVTLAGSIGAFVNGCTRLIVGFIYEKVGFKITSLGIALIDLIVCFLYVPFASSKLGFLLMTCLDQIVYGGYIATLPLITYFMYKEKGAVSFSYLFTAYTASHIVTMYGYSWSQEYIGLQGILWVIAGGSLISIFLIVNVGNRVPIN